MKHLIKASVIGAAASAFLAMPAHALIVDFTDGTYPNFTGTLAPSIEFSNADSTTIDPQGDLGNVHMILTATPGNLTANTDDSAPSNNLLMQPYNFNMAGIDDGYGIKDDEIDGVDESFSISFENSNGSDRNMWVSDIFLLDMFHEGSNGETANIAFFQDNAAVGTLSISQGGVSGSDPLVSGTGVFGAANNDGGLDGSFLGDILSEAGGGFLQISLADIATEFQLSFNEIVFSAADDGISDFAVAGLRIADVNFVPVPAALPLLLTGLAGLGLLSRRRKTA